MDVVWYFSEFLPIVNGGSYRVTELALSGCLIRIKEFVQALSELRVFSR